MLIRQKAVLALLRRVDRQLTRTEFVKLIFLLRHETDLSSDGTFYDFVPYRYGPFSFALYREVANLRRDGYLIDDDDHIGISDDNIALVEEKVEELPKTFDEAIKKTLRLHGDKDLKRLLKDVYARYPWYAINTELKDLHPKPPVRARTACAAVYTAGYQGKSVDAFLDHLLRSGIRLLIDVRANPVSRRYGFSKGQLSDIAKRLGLDYQHIPDLGIPSRYRTGLSDYNSYQRLLRKYEDEMIPHLGHEIDQLGRLMEATPAVLMCMEKDVRCCHRSRLADAVCQRTGLKVKHI